jgi:hypothetical protein
MSTQHGPPCGHAILGTCSGCGGGVIEHSIQTSFGPPEYPGGPEPQPGTFKIVRVDKESPLYAELLRQAEFDSMKGVFRKHIVAPKEPAPTPATTPRPIDPLDVEYDGISLRLLLEWDEQDRAESPSRNCGICSLTFAEHVWNPGRTCEAFAMGSTEAQRAAVSAHWSAQLRAKVQASEDARKAREPSVVAEVDADDLPWKMW